MYATQLWYVLLIAACWVEPPWTRWWPPARLCHPANITVRDQLRVALACYILLFSLYFTSEFFIMLTSSAL